MSPKTDTEVIIGGKVFTLSGYESEDYMQKIASYINGKITEYGKLDGFRRQPLDKQNILLQLNIADDYFKVDRDVKSVMKDNERKDKMVLEMKHKILEQETAEAELKEQMEELRKTLETSEKKVVELNVINQENVSKANEAEKKVSESEAEKTSTKTKLEAANEEIEQLKKELEEAAKREISLQEKYDKQEEKLADLREKSKKDLADAKAKYTQDGKKLKEKFETAKADLVKKYEAAKADINKKVEDGTAEWKEKYEQGESERGELKAKLEAAERRITDLESRNRKGKR